MDHDVLRERTKRMMRQRFRGLRASIPAAARAKRSAAIGERLLTLPEIREARSVALFWPIERSSEVDLRAVDSELRGAGITVAYPAIDPDTRVMRFCVPTDPQALVERGLGFAEPPPDAPEATPLDAIVVPGLAFDARGHRLGYGAGYYDKTLPRYRPPAIAVGVAFDFQLAAELPTDDSDVAVDRVVTDRRLLCVTR
jgi:5-formyltetrahydrofolate cyclo-ligase